MTHVAKDAVADGPYVMFNGDILGRLGTVDGATACMEHARSVAEELNLLPTVFASPADGNIYIFYDEARVVRPLLVTQANSPGLLPPSGIIQGFFAMFPGRWRWIHKTSTL